MNKNLANHPEEIMLFQLNWFNYHIKHYAEVLPNKIISATDTLKQEFNDTLNKRFYEADNFRSTSSTLKNETNNFGSTSVVKKSNKNDDFNNFGSTSVEKGYSDGLETKIKQIMEALPQNFITTTDIKLLAIYVRHVCLKNNISLSFVTDIDLTERCQEYIKNYKTFIENYRDTIMFAVTF